VRNLEANCCSSFTQELIPIFVIMVSLSRHFTYNSTCRGLGCVAHCTSCLRRKHCLSEYVLTACRTPQNMCDFLPHATEYVRFPATRHRIRAISCHMPQRMCAMLATRHRICTISCHTPLNTCDFLPQKICAMPATHHRRCAHCLGSEPH